MPLLEPVDLDDADDVAHHIFVVVAARSSRTVECGGGGRGRPSTVSLGDRTLTAGPRVGAGGVEWELSRRAAGGSISDVGHWARGDRETAARDIAAAVVWLLGGSPPGG